MEKDIEIIWSKEAIDRLTDVYIYLRLKWSDKVAENFEQAVEMKLRHLRKLPQMGPASSKKSGLHKILLSPHNYMLYQIEGSTIYIINIIDTRQNSSVYEVEDL